MPTVEGAMGFAPAPLPKSVALTGSTLHFLTAAEHAVGELSGLTARLVNGDPLVRKGYWQVVR